MSQVLTTQLIMIVALILTGVIVDVKRTVAIFFISGLAVNKGELDFAVETWRKKIKKGGRGNYWILLNNWKITTIKFNGYSIRTQYWIQYIMQCIMLGLVKKYKFKKSIASRWNA